jgi:hypothetical protein
LVVGAGFPGHATIQINGPDHTTYAGLGPAWPLSPIAPGQYDVITLPNGASPVGQLHDQDGEYSFVDASHYRVKSYTFEVSEEQALRARQAAVEYQKKYSKYNGASQAVCTDYALSILHAALPETDFGQLSRVPSILQKQLDEASQNGSVVSFPVDGQPDYQYKTHLPAFAPDPDAPRWSAPPKATEPGMAYPFGAYDGYFPYSGTWEKRSSQTPGPDTPDLKPQTAANTILQQDLLSSSSPLLRELAKRKMAEAVTPPASMAFAPLLNGQADAGGGQAAVPPSRQTASNVRILRSRSALTPAAQDIQVPPTDAMSNERGGMDPQSSFDDLIRHWVTQAGDP